MHYAGADANIAINIHIFAINCGGGEVIGGGVGDKAIPNKYKESYSHINETRFYK